MLTIVLVIVVGGIVGWLATLVMGESERHGLVGNVLIGIVGSFLAGLVTAMVTGRDLAELGTFTWTAFFWSLAGAIGLLLIIKALRNERKV